MAQLRAAIIGYGLAGRSFHAPLIAATEGLVVASVITSNAERRAQVEREHPDAAVHASVQQLWKQPPDLVVVATSNDSHAPLAREAIERGVPVVVDKPLAVNAAEARALIDDADQAGAPLSVFQNRRWDSDFLTLVRLREEGRLGEVFRYESRFERWRPAPTPEAWRESTTPELGGGQLLDLGSHLVDQALVLFGPATHAYGELAARRGTPADDDAFVALRHVSGVVSHLRMSAVTAAPGPRLRVLGSEASFVIEALDGQEDRLRAGERPDTVSDWGAEPESRWGYLARGENREPVPSEPGAWQHFYAAVARALRDGHAMPVDPCDALATLRVLEAARESAASSRVVALER